MDAQAAVKRQKTAAAANWMRDPTIAKPLNAAQASGGCD
jgi:hypothetical protein